MLVLYLPLLVGVALAIPVAALSGALAFYKINNKSFIEMLEAGFTYYTKGRLYLWRKEPKKDEQATQTPVAVPQTRQKLELSQSKLHELAWSLDIKDKNTQSDT